MITQKILILLQDAELTHGLKFPKGTEFEIVADVIYMGGYPVSQNLQKIIYDWLVANMKNIKLFKEDMRRFK
jgi:hypothetical protein